MREQLSPEFWFVGSSCRMFTQIASLRACQRGVQLVVGFQSVSWLLDLTCVTVIGVQSLVGECVVGAISYALET